MATSNQRRAEAKPVTPKNKQMSKKHLRESIAMNQAHAREHTKAIAEDKRKLGQLDKGTGYGSKLVPQVGRPRSNARGGSAKRSGR